MAILCLVVGGVAFFWPSVTAAVSGAFALDVAAVNKWPDAPPSEPPAAPASAPAPNLWAAARAGVRDAPPAPAEPAPSARAAPPAAPEPIGFEPAAVTHDGHTLKFSDAAAARVVAVDAGGRHATAFDVRDTVPGAVRGEPPEPAALAAAPGRTYLYDAANHAVRIHDSAGRYVGQLDGGGHMIAAAGIAADRTRVYTADVLANAVHVHAQDGTRIGFLAGTFGAFQTPGGIAVTPNHVLVSDRYAGAVYIFGKDGSGMAGRLAGALTWPGSIAVGAGHVWVADVLQGNVHVFDAAGRHVDTVADRGTEQYRIPTDLAHNGTHLFVADQTNGRIEIWDAAGRLAAMIP